MKKLTTLTLVILFLTSISKGQSFDWATASGGGGSDQAYAIATDNEGNSYVTGWFSGSAHFDDIVLESTGDQDVFLAKYNDNGEVLWAVRAYGPAKNAAAGITLDRDDFPIITGWFAEAIHFDDIILESHGSYDMFVARYSNEGNVIWARSAGGEGDDYGNRLTTNFEHDVIVSGSFRYTAHFGEETTITSEGNRDIFIANYSNAGNFHWVKKAGGAGEDRAYGIICNNDGATYFTGVFNGKAFFGEHDIMSNSFLSTFIAKMNAGGHFLWVHRGTGGANDYARGFGIGLDNEGYVYGNGTFSGRLTFSEETVEATGGQYDFDTYLVRYNHEGDIKWIRKAGGYGMDQGRDMFTDGNGNTFTTGFFSTRAEFGEHVLESFGKSDIFVAKYNWTGGVEWVKRAGGNYLDYGYGISPGNPQSLYICGNFQEDANFDEHEISGWGAFDMYIARLDYEGDFIDESDNGRLSIFPNPSNGTFELNIKEQHKSITIKIFSTDGKLVVEKQVANTQNHINVKTNLDPGVYSIQIPELEISSKLIIK